MNAPRLAILDYGMGNLRSAAKAFEHVGAEIEVTKDRERVRAADGVVLPGVGAFPKAMEAVRRLELDELLRERHEAGVPILGICLGMQMLTHTSEEGGHHQGLGWLPADVVRIDSEQVRVPHAGWNDTEVVRPSPIFAGLTTRADFYYTHSYHVQARTDGIVDAVVHHGTDLTAAVRQDNVAAVQFHPEKSQDHGLRVLTNFIEWDPASTC